MPIRLPYSVRPLDPWIEPITEDRRLAPFRAPWDKTLDLLDREIQSLGKHDPWVLQIDVTANQLRRDGMLHARATVSSPAIRICFNSAFGPLKYACDTFSDWQSNVRAVALSLEALRKVSRYGVASRGEQYRGWEAISAKPAMLSREQAAQFLLEMAADVIGDPHTATVVSLQMPASVQRMIANATYRRTIYLAACKAHHSDRGGAHDDIAAINHARDVLEGRNS